jgi:hypothetical protein
MASFFAMPLQRLETFHSAGLGFKVKLLAHVALARDTIMLFDIGNSKNSMSVIAWTYRT